MSFIRKMKQKWQQQFTLSFSTDVSSAIMYYNHINVVLDYHMLLSALDIFVQALMYIRIFN
jgi:hypothetical protein